MIIINLGRNLSFHESRICTTHMMSGSWWFPLNWHTYSWMPTVMPSQTGKELGKSDVFKATNFFLQVECPAVRCPLAKLKRFGASTHRDPWHWTFAMVMVHDHWLVNSGQAGCHMVSITTPATKISLLGFENNSSRPWVVGYSSIPCPDRQASF